MGFTFLPHTADLKVRAEGHSFVDACNHALQAITRQVSEQHVQSKQVHSISLSAHTKEALLFDLLNEAIYLLDAKNFLIHNATLHFHSENGRVILQGELHGDDAGTYETTGHIKAATYHDMKIEERDGHVVLEFVLDI